MPPGRSWDPKWSFGYPSAHADAVKSTEAVGAGGGVGVGVGVGVGGGVGDGVGAGAASCGGRTCAQEVARLRAHIPSTADKNLNSCEGNQLCRS